MGKIFRMSVILNLSLFFWATTTCSSAAKELLDEKSAQRIEHLYILTFDKWGVLTNPAELDYAIEKLSVETSIDKIIILSYGWAHDGRNSYSTYRKIVDKLAESSEDRSKLAVIAVGWDSSQSGFRKLMGDILPLPAIGEAIAWLPDKLLTALSFWSKAAYADRIGYGGLRNALNELFDIYETRSDHPDIFLLGHSFGTRVISALLVDTKKSFQRKLEPFKSFEHIAGAALMQPALVSRNIDKNAPFPVMVTMSRHDRAIGFLYPLANLPVNTYGLTTVEVTIQRNIYDRIEKRIERTTSSFTSILTRDERKKNEESFFRGSQTRKFSRRIIGETLALPVNFLFSVAAIPIGYIYTQGYGLVTQPVTHVMDTLAQIPLVEIPVDGLSHALGREIPWGQRGKGIFMLGGLNEGMGRLVPPALIGSQVPIYSLSNISQMKRPPNGVFVVDASDIIKTGTFGLDQSNPLVDYTLGWLDPLGAHSDYKNQEVQALLRWFANPPTPDVSL
jgi:pimeloyl-ACP methyl ester carboxylesterase